MLTSEHGSNAVRHKDGFLVPRIIFALKYRLKLLLAGTDDIPVQVNRAINSTLSSEIQKLLFTGAREATRRTTKLGKVVIK